MAEKAGVEAEAVTGPHSYQDRQTKQCLTRFLKSKVWPVIYCGVVVFKPLASAYKSNI